MSDGGGRSFIGRLVDVACGVFAACVGLFLGAQLVEAVWLTLVLTAMGILLLLVSIRLLSNRNRYW